MTNSSDFFWLGIPELMSEYYITGKQVVSFYSTMISGFRLNLIRRRLYKLKWMETEKMILQVTLDVLYIKHPNIHFHSVPGTCGTCTKRLDPQDSLPFCTNLFKQDTRYHHLRQSEQVWLQVKQVVLYGNNTPAGWIDVSPVM